MSETGQAAKKEFTQWWLRWANTGETGSRKWFWQMRIVHIHLWITPLIVVLAAASQFHSPGLEDPSLGERLMFSLPWVAIAVGAGALAHALWRIEVNMEANKARPFTKKDEAVYTRAMWIQFCAGSLAMGWFLVLLFVSIFKGLEAGSASQEAVDRFGVVVDAMYTPMTAVYLVMMFTHTAKRMHIKARTAHEELEKGV